MENVLTYGRQTMRKIQTSAFDTLCLRRVKKKKIDRQPQKELGSREDDRREGDHQTGSKKYQERIRRSKKTSFK